MANNENFVFLKANYFAFKINLCVWLDNYAIVDWFKFKEQIC